MNDCINALLSKMTLDEKIGQLTQIDDVSENIEELIRSGSIGSILGVFNPEKINQLQEIAIKESRLAIPLFNALDVVHGYETIFPIPLASSCSWNPKLVEESAKVAAEEAVAAGVDLTYAPMVDICRDPRWGRVAEGGGEDPYLVSVFSRAYVKGFQEYVSADGRRLLSCVKHFAAYGGAESGKDYNTVDISERTLRDIYLPPFKAAVDEGVAALMPSFNEISGIPSTINPFLLRDILRKEWQYEGLVVSDYAAINETIAHGVSHDLKEASEKSIIAGTDVDMMSHAYRKHLKELVETGKVSLALIDEAVLRVLSLKYKAGLFKNPYVSKSGFQVMGNGGKSKAREVAYKLASESLVLLKNEKGILPLDSTQKKKIAIIGPLAKAKLAPLGCWRCCGRENDTVSVYDGLSAVVDDHRAFLFAEGCEIRSENREKIHSAVEVAKEADVVIAILGEDEKMSGEAHSRAKLGLPGVQSELLRALVQTGKPVVMIVLAGRPLAIPEEIEMVAAYIHGWHLGTESGNAIAGAIFGLFNPSGRLSISVPVAEGQIPVYYAHKNTGRPVTGSGTIQFNQTHKSNYIDIPNDPLFPFGFGLSYTSFAYSDLVIDNPKLSIDDELKVSVKVSNTGAIDGAETVQLYVRDIVGSVTRPVRELKGFKKVFIKAGLSDLVVFRLKIADLGFYGIDQNYVIEQGEFELMVGSNSADGCCGKFIVE